MSEPIKDCSEKNEAKKGLGEFLVAGGDTTVDFDPTEEVLDLMTAPVVAAMETGRLPAAPFGRDAAAGALSMQAGPEDIGIKALVGHDSSPPHAGQQRHNGVLVMLRPGRKAECHGSSAGIDDSGTNMPEITSIG